MTTDTAEHIDRQYRTISSTSSSRASKPRLSTPTPVPSGTWAGIFPPQIDDLSEAQLTDYFSDLTESHSWSAVKRDLYGLKFYATYVLYKPWSMPHLIKQPKKSPQSLERQMKKRCPPGSFG